MAFGAKTLTALMKEVNEDASLTEFNAASNASFKMKSASALEALVEPLVKHKSIKKVTLTDCEIADDGCKFIAEILKGNHIIEELNLEKNKISSAGASIIADALASNKGLRTLNLMQQAIKNFGEETLEHFIIMFNDNVTLTKIMWRLESRKSFMLNKLQTRNVEIKKRQDKGADFDSFLPDHLKKGAAGAPVAAAAVPEAAPAPAVEAVPEAAPEEAPKKRSSVKLMEEHLAVVEAAVGELAAEEGYKAEDAAEAPYKAETVQAAWDNHFGAFGAQDVAKIMLDYNEESELRAWDHRAQKLDSCKGMAEIQKFFEGLFATLKDTSDLAAPTIDVTEDPKQVYLIWSCGASGIVSATDSFIFDDDNKISRQNIAFTSKE